MRNKVGQIKVGVGVMILKDGKVLLGKRKNAHGAGEYAFPGGHLEFGESVGECAKREAREETGIEIKNVKFLFSANLRQWPGKHYAHFGLIAQWKSGEPKVLESDNCENWDWYSLDRLPKPLFGTAPYSFEAYKAGKVFFETKRSQ